MAYGIGGRGRVSETYPEAARGAAGNDTSPIYQEAYDAVFIPSDGEPVTVVAVTPESWSPGDIAIVEWWAQLINNEDALVIEIFPYVDVGDGPVQISGNGADGHVRTANSTTAGLSTSFESPVSPNVSVQVTNGGGSDTQVKLLLRVTRVNPLRFQGAPSGTLP